MDRSSALADETCAMIYDLNDLTKLLDFTDTEMETLEFKTIAVDSEESLHSSHSLRSRSTQDRATVVTFKNNLCSTKLCKRLFQIGHKTFVLTDTWLLRL